ncbi:GNAT family N-acetyltransferase [Streptomyces sp. NPDC020096]
MKIRTGGPGDVAATLTLLDKAIVWLTARGWPDQWGTEPRSTRPSSVAHIEEYARDHLLRAAELDGGVVGVCVLAEAPPEYVAEIAERELYIRLLITDRDRSGSGIGAALVADACEEARRRGISLLRVDCYAGNGGGLVEQYRRLGFEPAEPFTVTSPTTGEPWPGQVLQRRL